MINIGDNPEGNHGVNKFLCGTEGLRGVIIAIHPSKRKAIIRSLNDSVITYTKNQLKKVNINLGSNKDSIKHMVDNIKTQTTLKIRHGKDYLISEVSEEGYPIALEQVKTIPKDFVKIDTKKDAKPFEKQDKSPDDYDECPDAYDNKKSEIQIWYGAESITLNWYKKEVLITYELEDFVELVKAFKYMLRKIDLNGSQTEKALQKLVYESENNPVSLRCDGFDKHGKPYFSLQTPPVGLTLSQTELLELSDGFLATEEFLKKRGLI